MEFGLRAVDVQSTGVAAVDLDDQEVPVPVVRPVVLVLGFELLGEKGLLLFGRPGYGREFLGARARVDVEEKRAILFADRAEPNPGVGGFQTLKRLKSARAKAPSPVRKSWKAPREG